MASIYSEIFSVGANINSIYSAQSRVHLLCANSRYRAYEYNYAEGYGQDLREIISIDNIVSGTLSISGNRWVHAVGSTLSVYGWNSGGERYPIGTINTPNGATITDCKTIGNRIYLLAGGILYGVEGYSASSQVSVLATNVKSVKYVDRMISILQTNGNWQTKNGSLTKAWTLQASSGVSKYFMAP